MEPILIYVVFPLIVGGVLAVFTAIYRAFNRLAERVETHGRHLAVHAFKLGVPFDD